MTAPARTALAPRLGRTARPRRRAALAAPALAAALLAACGTQTAGTVDGLPVLRIGTGTGEGVPAAMDSRSGGGVTLDGSLPTSPGSAPVARFSDGVDEADVRALATALGIAGQPSKRAHGWVVQDRGGVLQVRDDGGAQWAFSRAGEECPAYSVDVDAAWGSGVASCAVADATAGGGAVSSDGSAPVPGTSSGPSSVPGTSGGAAPAASGSAVAPSPPDSPTGTPTEPVPVGTPPGPAPTVPPAPSEAQALAAARTLLAAAGVEGDPRTSESGWAGRRSVVVDPRVAGLPTVGIRTVVDVDADGVAGATGWLASATAGDVYPLVSARDAFDRLSAQPRPMPAIGCPETRGLDDVATGAPAAPGGAAPTAQDMPMPCGGLPDIVVTGAQLGLMLAAEGTTPLLVPAWLFAVQGSAEPLPVLAVPDRYLGEPEPAPTASASSEPGDPGSTETPAPPPTGPGVDPSASSGSGAESTVAVEKAFLDRDGTTLALTGTGGVCAEYAGVVDEAVDAVTVQIVGRSTLGPDMACIEIAQEVEVVVTLEEPLGDRVLVDATTGREVPVQRT